MDYGKIDRNLDESEYRELLSRMAANVIATKTEDVRKDWKAIRVLMEHVVDTAFAHKPFSFASLMHTFDRAKDSLQYEPVPNALEGMFGEDVKQKNDTIYEC